MLIACHLGFTGDSIKWAISFLSNSTFFLHILLFQWTNSLYLRFFFFFCHNNPWGRQWFRVSLLLCNNLETSSLYAAVKDFLGINFISMVNARSYFLVHSTIWGGDCTVTRWGACSSFGNDLKVNTLIFVHIPCFLTQSQGHFLLLDWLRVYFIHCVAICSCKIFSYGSNEK